MRTIFLFLVLATVTIDSGCSTGFRIGGPRAGVAAGAAVGPQASEFPVPDNGYVPPPPDPPESLR
jgi:hypothetical protein